METPLTHGPPRGYPSFRTPAGLAAAIRATGWDACSTASNHTLDAGQRGVNTTLGALDRARVRHAGSHRTRAASRRPTILKAKGVKVAFLAYTALTNGQRIPHPWTLDMARARRILSDARRARRAGADAVIVNIHWGAEYQHAPTRAQRSLAASADALEGRHGRGRPARPRRPADPLDPRQAGRLRRGQPALQPDRGVLPGRLAGRADSAARPARVQRTGVRAVRVRYLPTYVRHPDFTVVHARGPSRARTIRVAGRSKRVVPIR